MFNFEEDTALYVKLSEGKLALMKKRTSFLFRGLGFIEIFWILQYEISNFTRSETSRCMHNVNTWKMNEWIGCGPSAASQFMDTCRNPSSIKEWLKGLENQDIQKDEVMLSEELLLQIA